MPMSSRSCRAGGRGRVVSPDAVIARRLSWLTLVSLWSAAAALQGSLFADHDPWLWGVWWCGTVVASGGLSWWLSRRMVPEGVPTVLALTGFVAPFVFEGGMRIARGPVNPWEVVLIIAVLTMGLALAVFRRLTAAQPLTMVCGLFVTLFAVSLSTAPLTCAGAIGFALCGVAWLAWGHWSRFADRGPKVARRAYPVRALLVSAGAILLPLLALGIVQGDRVVELAGFMPTSGGTGAYDSSARSGVGDGDALVAGSEDILSFGPIEDAPFRTSHDPTLYDLFDDSYSEPVSQRQDRAIALPREFKGAPEQRMAKSQQAGKEFSTHRKTDGGKRSKPVSNLASEALFYVKGRTPLHLRHAVFDLYDGVTWFPVASPPENEPARLSIQDVHGRPWLQWDYSIAGLDCLTHIEPHALKVVHLKTNRIPSPAHLRGIHLDQLKDVTFFRWDTDDLIAMNREALPELTAIHLRSATVDPEELSRVTYWGPSRDPVTGVLPEGGEMPRIRRLAEEWTAGVPRGWRQIEAIVQRLRTEYQHDRAYKPAEDVDSPLAEFLFVSRRGPDYQFATAAAVLLRSLGYSTRLVGGFYAAPENYEPRKGHTPVLGADAHVWCEVFQSGRTWFTVEPTPGYFVLEPPPAWWVRLAQAVWFPFRLMLRYWPLTLVGLACGTWIWRRGRELRDRWLLLRDGWFRPIELRARLLRTTRLLERRRAVWGAPRPPGRARPTWIMELAGLDAEQRATLLRLAELSDWAAYAPTDSAPPANAERDWSMAMAMVRNLEIRATLTPPPAPDPVDMVPVGPRFIATLPVLTPAGHS